MKDNSQNQNTEELFLKAFNDFSDEIFRFCLYKINDRELAKDITQTAFEKTWTYMASRGKKIDNIRAFLYKTARFLVIDEYRKNKPTSLDKLMDLGVEPASGGSGGEIKIETDFVLAREKIEKLPGKYREVLILRYVQDMAVKDIAELTGKSENAVSVRINRALKKLRKLLENNG